MATIVLHRSTNTRYVLVGSGHALDTTGENTLFTSEETLEQEMLAVCDAEGVIGWGQSREFVVESIDGKPPRALLEATGPYR